MTDTNIQRLQQAASACAEASAVLDKAITQREKAIRRAANAGMTLRAIAEHAGITYQRVAQIIGAARDEATAEFYEKAKWPVGTTVKDVEQPTRIGTIVKRGGQTWVTRDKMPIVRWHGLIDAEPVRLERLAKV